MNRQFVVAANWKMNKSPREAVEFLKDFDAKAREMGLAGPVSGGPDREVIFFVPAIDLWVAQEYLRSTPYKWGAQNCYFEAKGAFTGENSPAVLAEIGTPYTLVGHSERRTLFGETDADTGKKVKALQQFGIIPMLCVGETLAEREAGATNEVILRQLRKGLEHADKSRRFTLAYEPVWAIGTGRVATPEQANDAHAVLRKGLTEIVGQELAQTTPILYGGSVKPENSGDLKKQPEIDGFLVGGASLEVSSFLPLCR